MVALDAAFYLIIFLAGEYFMEAGLTYLWQEEYGERFYRVQTDDKDVAKKLYRRNGFRLSAYGVNSKSGKGTNPASGTGLWIFCCEFSRRDIAKKAIESVTGENGKIDVEGMYVFGNGKLLKNNNVKV